MFRESRKPANGKSRRKRNYRLSMKSSNCTNKIPSPLKNNYSGTPPDSGANATTTTPTCWPLYWRESSRDRDTVPNKIVEGRAKCDDQTADPTKTWAFSLPARDGSLLASASVATAFRSVFTA